MIKYFEQKTTTTTSYLLVVMGGSGCPSAQAICISPKTLTFGVRSPKASAKL